MLTIQVDDRKIMARLTDMPTKLHRALLKKTQTLAEKLKSKVQQNLTNNLLNIRTGKLVRSIFKEVEDSSSAVSGRVYSSGVPYARIQEFGGQTAAHVIEAKNGVALAFSMGGKMAFFKRVNHPGSKIKGAHYMGSAFDAMKLEIRDTYEEAVAEGTQ